MTLENKLDITLKQIVDFDVSISLKQLISTIDYTCLDTDATLHDIQLLATKAAQHHVAAVCVYPQHLDLISEALPLTRATVVNFPGGNDSLAHVLDSIETISNQHHVNEVDYVFPYQIYLTGDQAFALSHCRAVYRLCKQQQLVFKVILETGAFPSLDSIHQLSLQLIDSGCDFLKTSTGKISKGASIPAAFAMLLAIQESQSSCGIKLSGGIRTIEQAVPYIQLACFILKKQLDNSWFRLGASALLDACLASGLDRIN